MLPGPGCPWVRLWILGHRKDNFKSVTLNIPYRSTETVSDPNLQLKAAASFAHDPGRENHWLIVGLEATIRDLNNF